MKKPLTFYSNHLIKRITKKNGFSIICAFNNQQKLNQFLIKSLQNQDFPFELITIDNTNNHYSCAAETLNNAVEKAYYQYLMFVHQDIELIKSDWLSNVARTLDSIPLFGAVGVAGKNIEGLFASVYHGTPPHLVSSERLANPVLVQTLDGCLVITHKKIFKKIKFDKETCSGWYFYVTNYCLDLAQLGYKVYVLPQMVYHESIGPSNSQVYEQTKQAIISKHRKYLTKIYTTMEDWEIG